MMVSSKDAKGSKGAKNKKVSAVDRLCRLLCVFAPFPSLREPVLKPYSFALGLQHQ